MKNVLKWVAFPITLAVLVLIFVVGVPITLIEFHFFEHV